MRPSTTVWKYQIPFYDKTEIVLPKGAEILHIAAQNDLPCLWARIDPTEARTETLQMCIAGTGHWLDVDIEKHLGTFMTCNGSFVFHVFEIWRG